MYVAMLIKCLVKIKSSAVTCPTVQLVFAQMTMSDTFHQYGFYGPEGLEKLVTGPPQPCHRGTRWNQGR